MINYGATPVAPTLDARRDDVHLIFWCAHCRTEHVHGACSGNRGCPAMRTPLGRRACTCPVGSGDGHRVAHCANTTSPYYRSGYTLREIRPTEEVRA